MTVTTLLGRQEALQTEAARIVRDLALLAALGRVGTAVLHGSAAYGLMVWPDIDVSVWSPSLTAEAVFDALRPVVTHPQVTGLRYRNETGPHNPTGLRLDDRYFFMLDYLGDAGVVWKIDVSCWLARTARDERWDPARIAAHLTDEARLVILWLKECWHRLPAYRTAVASTDIYDAVLLHGVRTLAEFDTYLRAHGLPTRT